MKKLKLNKFAIAQLNRLDTIKGGAKTNGWDSKAKDCPTGTIEDPLEDPKPL